MKNIRLTGVIIGISLFLFVSIVVILKELTKLQAIKHYWLQYLISFSCIFINLYLIDKEGK
jgi:hypothetical protein